MLFPGGGLRFLVLVMFLVSVLWFGGPLSPFEGFAVLAERYFMEKNVTVVAVGDILLSRHIGKKIDQTKDAGVPFANVRQLLTGADIAFGNLESPVVAGDVPIRSGMVFRCLTRYVPGLISAGFDVLSTANNHAFDQGAEGVEFTIDYLDSKGIVAVGTRKAGDENGFGRLIERNGVVIGFLAYSYAAFNDGGEKTDFRIATWHDQEAVKSEIRSLKERVDVLFVSLHAGGEYRREPERRKVEFARTAIEAGADAIIGHHPHWIQPVEVYRGKPIFYSLGNFVFDQGHTLETSQGLMVEFGIRNSALVHARLIPVSIERYCCPKEADLKAREAILDSIGLDTDEIRFVESGALSGN